MNNPYTRFLGDLLVETELITKEQLETAMERQKVTNEKISKILIDEGFVSQNDIIRMLEFRLGIPHVRIEQFGVDQEACNLIPEALAKRHDVIPLKRENRVLIVAMSDPLNVFAIDDIRIITGMEVQPVISTAEDIQKAIAKNYGTQKAITAVKEYMKEKDTEAPVNFMTGDTGEGDYADIIKNAPVVKLVNTIIEQAVRNNASDIHIEPFEKQVKVRYRIDGRLKDVMHLDLDIAQSLTTRIKIVSNMNITEKRLPQDGRISIQVENRSYDLRVSLIPIVFGEKIVMRVIDNNAAKVKLEDLGFSRSDIALFRRMLKNPYGIILVTGPTGSGKSTTLYSGIQELNNSSVNIVTVEDPIESVIDGVCQIHVNSNIGLTFASSLRSILRQDPDIIMVGEIRDSETAQIATRAAITGHLVLSTLHTNDAASSVMRLIDMGIEPFMVASSLVGVVAQRLVRRICPNCKAQYAPTRDELDILGDSGKNVTSLSKGRGCPICLGTGYKGRIGIYEVMEITKHHREMIHMGCTQDELKDYSGKNGMRTIKEGAIRLVLEGQTTIQELQRVAFVNE